MRVSESHQDAPSSFYFLGYIPFYGWDAAGPELSHSVPQLEDQTFASKSTAVLLVVIHSSQ